MATACLGGLPAAISVLMFLFRAVLDADLMSAMGYSNLQQDLTDAARFGKPLRARSLGKRKSLRDGKLELAGHNGLCKDRKAFGVHVCLHALEGSKEEANTGSRGRPGQHANAALAEASDQRGTARAAVSRGWSLMELQIDCEQTSL